tara:strand:- start:6 stop:566 length:561 start_codon:yes stop_codon:yes gene_type:complete
MFKFFILIFFSCSVLYTSAQENIYPGDDNVFQLLLESTKPGFEIKDNTLFFSDEAKKLLSDSIYRNSIYAKKSSWLDLKKCLEENHFQLAFWHMINLYPQNKELIINYLVMYNQIIPIKMVLNASLFTYTILDPRISRIKDDKIDIYRPDIFEEHISVVDEMIHYISNVEIDRNDSSSIDMSEIVK